MEKGTADNLPAKSNGTPANAPVLVNGVYDWSNQVNQKLLKSTVAKGANDEEFALFRELCRATGLNPYRKEIWCIPGKEYNGNRSAPQIMTGINGFYRIANGHNQYDGTELEYGPYVSVPLIKNDAGLAEMVAPEWVEARVFRKDRSRPQTFRAYWREYARELVTRNGKLGIWAKNPTAMLTKCAESMALRKAFPQELNGLYTEEESPIEYSVDVVSQGVSHEEQIAHQAADRLLDELFNPENLQGTYRHLKIKFGENAGKFLGDKKLNGFFMRKHIEKYRGKYTADEQKAFVMRIAELDAEYEALKAHEKAEQERLEAARMNDGGTYIAVSEPTDESETEY